jgi:ABC-type Zn uptake system ZnuABC Zn-binding protein ZnuA
MKKKLVLTLITLAMFLSACTLRICTPTYVDAITGQQQYSCKDYRKGASLPVVTVINPYRQMTRR